MNEEAILHLIVHYGYVGIFGALMFGIIGLPVPDEVLLTFAGFLVSIGRLQYVMTILVAAAGSLTGMSISFIVGDKLGLPFLQKYGSKVHLTPERLAGVEHWFTRFGKVVVTIGYFIPGLRHLTALFAGISHWTYRTFLLYALPGSLLWALTFVTTGKYVGFHWRFFSGLLHRYLLLAIGVGVVVAGGWWLLRRRKKSGIG